MSMRLAMGLTLGGGQNGGAAVTRLVASTVSLPETTGGGVVAATLAIVGDEYVAPASFIMTAGNTTLFEIVGNELRTKAGASFDYETAASYPITIEGTDSAPNVYSRTFNVSITNVNEAPNALVINNSTVHDGVPDGFVVGTLVATDPDNNDVLDVDWVPGFTSDDFDLINPAIMSTEKFIDIIVKPGSDLNFSTKPSNPLQIRVTDSGGLFTDFTITITVTQDPAMMPVPLQKGAIAWHKFTDTSSLNLNVLSEIVRSQDRTGNGHHLFGLVANELPTWYNGPSLQAASFTINSRLEMLKDIGGTVDIAITLQTVDDAYTIFWGLTNEYPFAARTGATTGAISSNSGNNIEYIISGVETPMTNQAQGFSALNSKTTALYMKNVDLFTALKIGGYAGSLNLFGLNAYVGEIIFLPANQSNADINDIGNYLAGEIDLSDGWTDLNTPPNGITLDSTDIIDGSPIGTVVGIATGIDPDGAGGLTVTIAPGGDPENSLTMVGDELRTTVIVDFASNPEIPVTLRVDDGEFYYDETFIIDVVASSVAFTPDLTPTAFLYRNPGISSTVHENDTAGEMSIIDDITGNGHDGVQGSSSNRVLTGAHTMGGKNVLSKPLASSQYFITDLSGLGNTFTFMFLSKVFSANNWNSGLFNITNTKSFAVKVTASGTERFFEQNLGLTSTFNTDSSVPIGEASLFCAEFDFDAETVELYKNGVLTRTYTNYTGGDFKKDYYAMTRITYLAIEIDFAGDVIYQLVNEDLRQRNEGFFMHDRGLQSLLPSGHPFKTDPPTTDGMFEVDGILLTEPLSGIVYTRSVGENTAQVPVNFTYTGTDPTAVEARIMEGETEIVGWTEIDASPSDKSGGSYLTVSTDLAGRTMEVRRSENTSLVSIGSNSFYVGIGVVSYGQSNKLKQDIGGNTTGTEPEGGTMYFDGTFHQADRAGGVSLGNEVVARAGLANVHTNGAVNGVSAEYLAGLQVNQSAINWIEELMAGMSPNADYIDWHQGEHATGGGGTAQATQIAWIDVVHTKLAAFAGRTKEQIPFILSGLSSFGIDERYDIWSSVQNTLQQAAIQLPHVHYSHSNLDVIRAEGDVYHWDASSYARSAARTAQTIAFLEGVPGANIPAWFITAATKINSTTTDITVSHSMGDDFTPTTGITGFQVTDDGFTTEIVPSAAVRVDATTIRLTHAAVSGTVLVRYQYGQDPDVTGMVKDNGDLNSPLCSLYELEAV